MISAEEARTRVARGAAHLDVVRPGWFNRIDVGTLTLSDCSRCVIGQLDGVDSVEYFMTGVSGLFPPTPMNAQGIIWNGRYYGVGKSETDGPDDRGYRLLQDAWIEAVADRRLSTTVEPQTAIDAVGLTAVEPVAVNARQSVLLNSVK